MPESPGTTPPLHQAKKRPGDPPRTELPSKRQKTQSKPDRNQGPSDKEKNKDSTAQCGLQAKTSEIQSKQGRNSSTASKQRKKPANKTQPPQGRGESQGRNKGNNHGASHKNYVERNIAAQETDAAFKDGVLDVQSFISARGFEIKALDESMRRTRVSVRKRAFQQVPFRLRRRAAAHNHKKTPRRLQDKAKWEMERHNTLPANAKSKKRNPTRRRLREETALRLERLAAKKRKQKLLKKGGGDLSPDVIETRMARPKIKRNSLNEPSIVAKKFKKRQKNKIWLATHLWHAKRARMSEPSHPLWGFSISLTPTLKSYRPSHRMQFEHGAIAWDMSYMSTIALCGHPNNVEHVLRAMGLTADRFWNELGSSWRAGAVHWSVTLSRRNNHGVNTIGPATIIWSPEPRGENGAPSVEKASAHRRLIIRVHPSVFTETFDEFFRLIKGQNPRPFIEDLRYEIGSIEITGAGAAPTEILSNILRPYQTDAQSKEPHATRFESLASTISPSSLTPGTLLAFSIRDPRLFHPPRVNLPKDVNSDEFQRNSQRIQGRWHEGNVPQPIALFDRDARFKATKLPSQKSLNRRRGALPPGTVLEPTEADPAIPILVLGTVQPTNAGTWTIMMPWKCVLPVWYSLMHCALSPRCKAGKPLFGGVDEIRQLAFEQGKPWFPGDYPATAAGALWERQQREKRKKAWTAMPKSKRTNYETLDLGAGRKGEVGEGWSCDFEKLLGQPLDKATHVSSAAFKKPLKSGPAPPTGLVIVKITILGRGSPESCARIYSLPSPPAKKPSTQDTQDEEMTTEFSPSSAVPHDTKLPPNLRTQWLSRLPKPKLKSTKPTKSFPPKHYSADPTLTLDVRKQLLARELTSGSVPAYPAPPSTLEDINGHPLCPGEAELLGFVTTGGFNLRTGRGEAVGSLAVERARVQVGRCKGGEEGRYCVVRNAGRNVGWLARWDLM